MEAGEVVDARWAFDVIGDALPPAPHDVADLTVDALFEHVRVGLDEGYSLDVTYDAVDGHPTIVDDQGFEDTTDDEVFIEVLELRLG